MKKKYAFTEERIRFLIEHQGKDRKSLAEEFNHRFSTDYPAHVIRQELYKHTDKRLQKKTAYTIEQEDFIRENANRMNRKALTKAFNDRFSENFTYTAITQKCLSMGLDKIIERVTEEQVQFLIQNYRDMGWKELTLKFNERFATDFSIKGLNRILYERGYRKYDRNRFTDEQRMFLMENLERYSYPELTQRFNEKFSTHCTQGSITQQCLTYLKIKKGESYVPHNVMDIGTEVTKYRSSQYAKTYVKIKGGCKERKSEMWIPKQQAVWEQHNRPLKEDEIVIFLDGDRTNFDIENLYCIPHKIMCLMNLNKWFTDSREHTLTAIKWCELLYAMKSNE